MRSTIAALYKEPAMGQLPHRQYLQYLCLHFLLQVQEMHANLTNNAKAKLVCCSGDYSTGMDKELGFVPGEQV